MNDPDKQFSHCVLRNWDSGDEPCVVEGEPLTLGPQTTASGTAALPSAGTSGTHSGRECWKLTPQNWDHGDAMGSLFVSVRVHVCVCMSPYTHVCACVHECFMCPCVCAHAPNHGHQVSDLLELDLQVVVSWSTQVLGIKLRSSGRIIHTL